MGWEGTADDLRWVRHVSTRCPNMALHNRVEVVGGKAVNTSPFPCPDCYSIESFYRRILWEPDGAHPASAVEANESAS